MRALGLLLNHGHAPKGFLHAQIRDVTPFGTVFLERKLIRGLEKVNKKIMIGAGDSREGIGFDAPVSGYINDPKATRDAMTAAVK